MSAKPLVFGQEITFVQCAWCMSFSVVVLQAPCSLLSAYFYYVGGGLQKTS